MISDACYSGYESRRFDGYDYSDEHAPEKADVAEREGGKAAQDPERPMSASPHDYDHRQTPKEPSEEAPKLERPASRERPERPVASREDTRKEMASKREDSR